MSQLSDFTSTEKLQSIDCTGVSTLSLDCKNYNVFYLTDITVDIDITLSNMSVGRTVSIVTNNGISSVITFTDTILWPGGTAPEFTIGTDSLVLTRISSTIIVGGYTLELS